MPKSKIPKEKSIGEETLALQLRAEKITGWVRECTFHPTRRWRADFVFPNDMLMVEVEGGIWTGGGHTRGAGFTKDCEKYYEAGRLGWHVMRVTTEQVTSGKAIEWIKGALDE